jgi:AcrR family transcriptional regulator
VSGETAAIAPPPRRRQEDRSARSERLLMEAAVELLVSRGIDGTTLNAIAEGSGYSRGLVTHRFGSKAGLLSSVHDTVAQRWIAHVSGRVGDAVGVEALRQLADALLGFIAESPQELRALYLLRYTSIDAGAEFRANVAKVNRAQRRDVERWIEAGQNNGTIAPTLDAALHAEMFCALLDGLIYRWLVNPNIEIGNIHQLLKDQLVLFEAAAPAPAG